MKYRTLLNMLWKMTEEELDQDAVVYSQDNDEYYPVTSAMFVGDEQDVLDPDHFVINA